MLMVGQQEDIIWPLKKTRYQPLQPVQVVSIYCCTFLYAACLNGLTDPDVIWQRHLWGQGHIMPDGVSHPQQKGRYRSERLTKTCNCKLLLLPSGE